MNVVTRLLSVTRLLPVTAQVCGYISHLSDTLLGDVRLDRDVRWESNQSTTLCQDQQLLFVTGTRTTFRMLRLLLKIMKNHAFDLVIGDRMRVGSDHETLDS